MTPPSKIHLTLSASLLSGLFSAPAAISQDADDKAGVTLPERYQDAEVVEVMGRQETLTEVPA